MRSFKSIFLVIILSLYLCSAYPWERLQKKNKSKLVAKNVCEPEKNCKDCTDRKNCIWCPSKKKCFDIIDNTKNKLCSKVQQKCNIKAAKPIFTMKDFTNEKPIHVTLKGKVLQIAKKGFLIKGFDNQLKDNKFDMPPMKHEWAKPSQDPKGIDPDEGQSEMYNNPEDIDVDNSPGNLPISDDHRIEEKFDPDENGLTNKKSQIARDDQRISIHKYPRPVSVYQPNLSEFQPEYQPESQLEPQDQPYPVPPTLPRRPRRPYPPYLPPQIYPRGVHPTPWPRYSPTPLNLAAFPHHSPPFYRPFVGDEEFSLIERKGIFDFLLDKSGDDTCCCEDCHGSTNVEVKRIKNDKTSCSTICKSGKYYYKQSGKATTLTCESDKGYCTFRSEHTLYKKKYENIRDLIISVGLNKGQGSSWDPHETLDWLQCKQTSATNIQVTIVLECEKHSSKSEHKKICALMQEGIKKYWGGTFKVGTKTYSTSIKFSQKTSGDRFKVDLYYEKDKEFERSHNIGILWIDSSMFYNYGFFDGRETMADRDFMETAAHEIGHSFLKAYKGKFYSWGHKGSSTKITQAHNDDTPKYPTNGGDIDIMKYYKGDPPGTTQYYKSIKVVNNDFYALIVGCGKYSI